MPNDISGSVLDAGNSEGDSDTTPVSWGDGYNDLVEAKGWESPADVLASYTNLEKAVGADKVVLPLEDQDLREWDGWGKLGTPEEASGYNLAAPEGFEHYDQGLGDWFREAAHENKMPAVMAQSMHDKFVERMGTSYTEQAAETERQNDEWLNEIKTKYGTAFDERVAAANSALREFGGDALRDTLNNAGLGTNPAVIDALSKIGVALGKGPQFKDSESSGQFGTTPEMAKEQIAKIRANPGLMDVSHPEHRVLNDKLTRLTELAFGTDPVS